jgi:hypothetical protein
MHTESPIASERSTATRRGLLMILSAGAAVPAAQSPALTTLTRA